MEVLEICGGLGEKGFGSVGIWDLWVLWSFFSDYCGFGAAHARYW